MIPFKTQRQQIELAAHFVRCQKGNCFGKGVVKLKKLAQRINIYRDYLLCRVMFQTHKHTPYIVYVLETRDPSTLKCSKKGREKKLKTTFSESPPEKALSREI